MKLINTRVMFDGKWEATETVHQSFEEKEGSMVVIVQPRASI